MPEYYDIVVSIWGAYRPGATSHAPRDYTAFAGVAEMSTRPEGPTVRSFAAKKGWTATNGTHSLGSPPSRKLVKIELPEGVHKGDFRFGNINMHGMYANRGSGDGMGQCVPVWCNDLPEVRPHDWEEAIDAAIASGISLSVPTAPGEAVEPIPGEHSAAVYGIPLAAPSGSGGRRIVQAKVVAVSEMFGSTAPEDWPLDT